MKTTEVSTVSLVIILVLLILLEALVVTKLNDLRHEKHDKKALTPMILEPIFEAIKRECFSTKSLNLDFIGDEQFTLICVNDSKKSKEWKNRFLKNQP